MASDETNRVEFLRTKVIEKPLTVGEKIKKQKKNRFTHSGCVKGCEMSIYNPYFHSLYLLTNIKFLHPKNKKGNTWSTIKMNSQNDPSVKVEDEILKLLCKVIYTFL